MRGTRGGRVLVRDGAASETEFDEARAAIAAFLDDPSSIAVMVNVVALGRKPR